MNLNILFFPDNKKNEIKYPHFRPKKNKVKVGRMKNVMLENKTQETQKMRCIEE